MKKFLSICTAFAIMAVSVQALSISTFATDSPSTNKEVILTSYSVQEMKSIAINALTMDFEFEADSGSWENVQIVKETPIYDLTGNLSAYCFDLKCDNQTAYIIIGADNSTYPIRQFCPHATSPYLNTDNDYPALYLGPGQYYLIKEDENVIEDIYSDNSVNLSDVVENSLLCQPQTVQPQKDYSQAANSYISGIPLVSASQLDSSYPRNENLEDVPLFQWRKGCVPTSMAMIFDYHFNEWSSSNELIDELADNMGTVGGHTLWASGITGAKSTLYFHEIDYTSLGFVESIRNEPFTGPSVNTLDDYKDEIMNDRPVFIAMENATATSPNYPDGFGDHATVGVGFSTSSLGNPYLIMHTTSVDDGDAYVPYDDDLGDYAWCFVVP